MIDLPFEMQISKGTIEFWRDTIRIRVTDPVVGDAAETILPSAFALDQNYPNPFNQTTIISYQLPSSSHVSLNVYDLLGRRMATLVDENKPAGVHLVQFDAGNLASGVYLYRMTAGSYVDVKKFVFLK